MELVYQYLWRYGLFGRRLPLRGGGEVGVVHPGLLNRDSGPDFFNARLRFFPGGSEKPVEWTGNVEIHVKASDWYRHGHHIDPAYDSVVLHVVGCDDTPVTVGNGRPLPTVLVALPTPFYLTVAELKRDFRGVRCQQHLPLLTQMETSDWIESLAMERLQMKAGRVNALVEETGGDWRRAFFITLARGLGFGLNGLPFEMLAKSLSMNYLGRHADNPLQIEAMLFGQAGMLDPGLHRGDEYYQLLCREYRFLAVKYGLRPMARSLWKYSRTRPGNFPHRRIAMLASALVGGMRLLDRILEAGSDEKRLRALFDWQMQGYWENHTDFGAPSRGTVPPRLSHDSVGLLLINVVAPTLYAYGMRRGSDRLAEEALHLLENLPAERNGLIAQWVSVGLRPADAMRSQALIHLRKEYCDPGRCLDCRFAYHLLKRCVQAPPAPTSVKVCEMRPPSPDDIVDSDYDVWAY